MDMLFRSEKINKFDDGNFEVNTYAKKNRNPKENEKSVKIK